MLKMNKASHGRWRNDMLPAAMAVRRSAAHTRRVSASRSASDMTDGRIRRRHDYKQHAEKCWWSSDVWIGFCHTGCISLCIA